MISAGAVMARLGMASHVVARFGRCGMDGQASARHGDACSGSAGRHGLVWQVTAQLGRARLARAVMAFYGGSPQGVAGYGSAGLARPGWAWSGLAGRGSQRKGFGPAVGRRAE